MDKVATRKTREKKPYQLGHQEQENTTEIHVGFTKMEPRVRRTRETHKDKRKNYLNIPEIKNMGSDTMSKY